MSLYGTEWRERGFRLRERSFLAEGREDRVEIFVTFRVSLNVLCQNEAWREENHRGTYRDGKKQKKYMGHMSDVRFSAESKIHYIHLPPAEYKYDPGMGFISV
jgi:hypothetical protein